MGDVNRQVPYKTRIKMLMDFVPDDSLHHYSEKLK